MALPARAPECAPPSRAAISAAQLEVCERAADCTVAHAFVAERGWTAAGSPVAFSAATSIAEAAHVPAGVASRLAGERASWMAGHVRALTRKLLLNLSAAEARQDGALEEVRGAQLLRCPPSQR